MANYAEKPQMGFIEACSTACKKIVTFKGRARRSEFWWAVLGIFIIDLIMTPVGYMGTAGVIISNLVSLVITILSLSLTFRRLHDTGRSGWFVGIPFIICMIGLVVICYSILSMGINIFELIETPDMLSQEIIENMSNSTSMNIMAALHSRIRPTLQTGSVVTDTRVNTMYVVTEYGCVCLKGLSVWERAEKLISIAHPDFREELIRAAEQQKIWYPHNRR